MTMYSPSACSAPKLRAEPQPPLSLLSTRTEGSSAIRSRIASAGLNDPSRTITVSIRADGTVFVQDQAVPFESLSPRVKAMDGGERSKPIYVRADGRDSYAVVAQVMASLSTSGFSSINLITDTGGPSSGATDPSKAP